MSKWATSKKLCGENYLRGHAVSSEQGKVISRLSVCRTHFLGGHAEQCDSCGYLRNAHNSCRNRHCPKCQGMAKEKWVGARKAELLPCGYFHEVFTLPHILNPLILCNRKILPDLLFETVSTVLAEFASDPKVAAERPNRFHRGSPHMESDDIGPLSSALQKTLDISICCFCFTYFTTQESFK